jgi:hypothetical protein
MTTSTSTSTGLRRARKEQAAAKAPAKKVAAKVAAKAPAKKATAPVGDKVTYAATGRGGAVRTTQSATPMLFAVDVSEPKSTNARAKAGRVWGFFATKDQADKAAARANAAGNQAIVVAAKAVTA